MKKHKRTIIVVVAILILLLTLIGIKLKIFEYAYSMYNNFKYSKIEYDVKISYIEANPPMGGLASTSEFIQIDIESKKAYLIENYHIYGVAPEYIRGDHYKIKNKIKLSDSEVEQLIEIANRESNYEEELKKLREKERENNDNTKDGIWGTAMDFFGVIDYYLIEYGGKETKLVCPSVPEITRLFKN